MNCQMLWVRRTGVLEIEKIVGWFDVNLSIDVIFGCEVSWYR